MIIPKGHLLARDAHILLKHADANTMLISFRDQGWGAVSDLSLISDLSQKFKYDLWRVKSELKLSQKQHLTPVLVGRSSICVQKG